MTPAERLNLLERRAAEFETRLHRLEVPVTPAPVAAFAPPVAERRDASGDPLPQRPAERGDPVVDEPATSTPASSPSRGPGAVDLEALLGGRVLAWAGGLALLVGLALLFALGVSDGWIGEGLRCALGGGLSLALVGLGALAHERRGHLQAARAAVAAGLGGAFLTLTVASTGYDLLAPALGLALAAAVGTLGVALAIRWASPVVAALGLVGALLSPVLAGVDSQAGGLGFLVVATAAAVAVLVWQRWGWLSLAVAVVVTPQWLTWALDGHAAAPVLLVLATFGLLQAASAVGTAVRAPQERLTALAVGLLAVNAAVLAAVGWTALDGEVAQLGWLAALALAHVGLGLAVRRTTRLPGDLGLLALTLGVVLADLAYGLGTDGVAQGLGWAAGAVAFAALTRRAHAALAQEHGAVDLRAPFRGATRAERDSAATASALGLHVGLGVLTALPAVDPAALLGGSTPDAASLMLVASLAGACLVSARVAPALRVALDVTGLAATALLAALALDGAALTVAWSLQAIALAALGARHADPNARVAALVHLGAATAWCLVDQAGPAGLASGVDDLPAALLGGGAVLGAAARLALLATGAHRRRALGTVALGGLYLASLAVVDLGDPAAAGLRLSGLWAAAGVAVLVTGLRRDEAPLRRAALALLGATALKVCVVDLATQPATLRVVSFLGLGVLLLGAAFAYQRLRPGALPDLRDVPPGLR